MAAGIPAFLLDAWTVGVAWTYSQAIGWIRLSVAEKDREAATELLESDFSGQIGETSVDAPVETCPSCGSEELAVERGSRKTVALMTLLGALTFYFPLWFWRSRLSCRTCGWSNRVPLRFRPELTILLLGFALAALLVPLAAVFALALVTQFLKKFGEFY